MQLKTHWLFKELRAKIKRIEEDRERELADHGSVLAEMQQRYAKERANCEQMERQVHGTLSFTILFVDDDLRVQFLSHGLSTHPPSFCFLIFGSMTEEGKTASSSTFPIF